MLKKLIIISILSGCASQSIVALDAEFEPSSDRQSFRYSNIANFVMPKDDPKSEETRIDVLVDLLEANEMCPNGYSIIERQYVVTVNISPPAGKIIYSGRCR